MLIPHQSLQPDTLRAVIEEFITREGTEYGEQDYSLASKVAQVLQQLERGEVVIVYSELHESCTLMPRAAYDASQA